MFPVETAFAAALLVENGHEIVPFDLNLAGNSPDWTRDFEQLIIEFKPDVVVSAPQALTFFIKECTADTAVAFKLSKKLDDGIVTVYCGPFATSYPQRAQDTCSPDFIIRGEYDSALLSMVNNIPASVVLSGSDSRTDAAARDGGMSFIEDFDSLPFPAYKQFGYKNYFAYRGKGNLRYAEHSERYTHYTTSRGCTCKCCFCNVGFLRGGRKFRKRAVPTVLDDLERINTELGIEEIHFLDENMTLNRRRTAAICDGIIERGLDFKWLAAGGMSVYSLNKEILVKMKESGCYRLNLAFESGDQAVLRKIIRKPLDLKKGLALLETARELDFEIIGYFVIGLPGEARAQIQKTLDLASHHCFDYVTISIATPLAGSELEKICKRDGLIEEKARLSEISRRSTGVFGTDEFTPFELEEIRWKMWDNINFSDRQRRERLCRILGLSDGELAELRDRTASDFHQRHREND